MTNEKDIFEYLKTLGPAGQRIQTGTHRGGIVIPPRVTSIDLIFSSEQKYFYIMERKIHRSLADGM
jgi:hypothetical protein